MCAPRGCLILYNLYYFGTLAPPPWVLQQQPLPITPPPHYHLSLSPLHPSLSSLPFTITPPPLTIIPPHYHPLPRFKVHRVLRVRNIKNSPTLHLVKWRDLSYEYATWEPEGEDIPGGLLLQTTFNIHFIFTSFTQRGFFLYFVIFMCIYALMF